MENQTINIPAKNAASVFANIRGSHVALRVPDFEAIKKWYVEKLDFRVIHEWSINAGWEKLFSSGNDYCVRSKYLPTSSTGT